MITGIIILKGTILSRKVCFCFDSYLSYIKTQIINKEHIKLNKKQKG